MRDSSSESTDASTRAQAYFLHDRLLASNLSQADQEELAARVKHASSMYSADGALASALEPVVLDILQSGVPEFDVLYDLGEVRSGRLVTLSQAFYFRREGDERVIFHATSGAHPEVGLAGRISPERMIGSTGRDLLSGRKRVTMLATIDDVEGSRVSLTPMFIGKLYDSTWAELPMAVDDRREVWPGQIDEFSRIKDTKRPTERELSLVASMPEEAIKTAFAAIVGEPYIPADWGGERSDLLTNRIHIEGQPIAAAFAFKGPGLQGALYVSNMGKRGDQGVRLSFENVDLMVVQHHNRIDATVSSLLSAYARQHRRRFMLLDGFATAHVLKAYGRLPA